MLIQQAGDAFYRRIGADGNDLAHHDVFGFHGLPPESSAFVWAQALPAQARYHAAAPASWNSTNIASPYITSSAAPSQLKRYGVLGEAR